MIVNTSARTAGGTAVAMDIESMNACCTPVTAAGLTELDAAVLAEGFKALADPARLRLLSLIANGEGGEACACDLVEPLERSQPTVSHHLAILVNAGLITREKRGKWAWYRLVPERLVALRAALGS
jgi:ArsR family transcriptional regulator